MRLTTRQTFQLHGVLKKDLKTVFSTVIKNMGSTLGACGDVNRNVIAPPSPIKSPEYAHATQLANDIADLLAPQSGAYYDVWLDGEKFMSCVRENPKVTADRAFNGFGTNFEGSAEPIYGTQFLPRKFKIAVTIPGDNSVDVFTNDLGVVCIFKNGEVQVRLLLPLPGSLSKQSSFLSVRVSYRGTTFWSVVASGVLIVTTTPSLAWPTLLAMWIRMTFSTLLRFVTVQLPSISLMGDNLSLSLRMQAIVATQRDYGRRDDRKQARLKYLVHEWGINRFRGVVEQYMGKAFKQFKPLPAWENKEPMG